MFQVTLWISKALENCRFYAFFKISLLTPFTLQGFSYPEGFYHIFNYNNEQEMNPFLHNLSLKC